MIEKLIDAVVEALKPNHRDLYIDRNEIALIITTALAAMPQPEPVAKTTLPLPSWKEQAAFEEWAKESRYEMHQHPLHYLFVDKQTDAARQGWKAALLFVRQLQDAALAAMPQPEPVAYMRRARLTYISGQERDVVAFCSSDHPDAYPVYRTPPRDDRDAEIERLNGWLQAAKDAHLSISKEQNAEIERLKAKLANALEVVRSQPYYIDQTVNDALSEIRAGDA